MEQDLKGHNSSMVEVASHRLMTVTKGGAPAEHLQHEDPSWRQEPWEASTPLSLAHGSVTGRRALHPSRRCRSPTPPQGVQRNFLAKRRLQDGGPTPDNLSTVPGNKRKSATILPPSPPLPLNIYIQKIYPAALRPSPHACRFRSWVGLSLARCSEQAAAPTGDLDAASRVPLRSSSSTPPPPIPWLPDTERTSATALGGQAPPGA